MSRPTPTQGTRPDLKLAQMLGIQIVTSPNVPRFDERVFEYRRENLAIIAHGGSLLDCEKPGDPGPIAYMIGGKLICHPLDRKRFEVSR